MELVGRLQSIARTLQGKFLITFEVDASVEEIGVLADSTKEKELELSIKPRSKRRSIQANKLLWKCIAELAKADPNDIKDPWEVYLDLLLHYGEYVYITVIPEALETLKKCYREQRVVGEKDIAGRKLIEVICFQGSSTYNSKQFSRLLDGVKQEMIDQGIMPPPSQDMRRAIERLERYEQKV